jgi:hypothetical protein
VRRRFFIGGSYFFFAGTFLPSFRAFESPIAIACFGFVTFLPLRPDFNLPFFISRISVSTFLPADGEYLRPDDLLRLDFLEVDFFAEELRLVVPRLRELELDFFLAAFLVAMTILLEGQMAGSLRQVVYPAKCALNPHFTILVRTEWFWSPVHRISTAKRTRG